MIGRLVGWLLPTTPVSRVLPSDADGASPMPAPVDLAEVPELMPPMAAPRPRTCPPPPVNQPRLTYSYGCVGLCSGDGCQDCQGIADAITAARTLTDPAELRAREAELAEQIAALTVRNTNLEERQ